MPNWAWTWIFQIVNFLILMYLLKRFLYGPILKAIDQREKKIAAHFEAAEQKEQDAIRKNETLDAEKRDLDAKRESMLVDAKADADKHRKELTAEAQKQVEALSERWREDLERQKDAFLEDIATRAGEGVCAVARKTLADLADAKLEGLMVGVLLRRLAEVPDTERSELAKVVKASGKPLIVATAWELPEEGRKQVAAAIGEHVAKDVEVAFETAPEITCGIELRTECRKISWTVAAYIQGIRDQLAGVIDEKIEKKQPKKKEEPKQ